MRKLTLKEFIEEFKPVKQSNDRTYKKYFIINDRKVSTLYPLSKRYKCNVFTGTQEGNILTLTPGKIFHEDNSFFIIVDTAWSDDEQIIEVNVKNKK